MIGEAKDFESAADDLHGLEVNDLRTPRVSKTSMQSIFFGSDLIAFALFSL